ncbi:hypothetical protein QP597_17645 [Providencia stuartii]|nr:MULTISPECIES: hypothetical protein [Providencia]MDK7738132.1 hypothetical protein [Providencia stuartii]MDN7223398.1 hypothetical protein [Providencia stuartii]MDQ5991808.1 hypothetical protein [Providencia stuartii]
MPVWLNTIPPAAAKVPRPNTRRWLVVLLIILFMGFALTLWFWTKDRTGFIFWWSWASKGFHWMKKQIFII